MQLPILVEPTKSGRFRAHVGEPFHVAAEADDAARAIQDLASLVAMRLQGGAKIAALNVVNGTVEAPVPPLLADDAYKTDWAYQELADAITENRRLEESAGP